MGTAMIGIGLRRPVLRKTDPGRRLAPAEYSADASAVQFSGATRPVLPCCRKSVSTVPARLLTCRCRRPAHLLRQRNQSGANESAGDASALGRANSSARPDVQRRFRDRSRKATEVLEEHSPSTRATVRRSMLSGAVVRDPVPGRLRRRRSKTPPDKSPHSISSRARAEHCRRSAASCLKQFENRLVPAPLCWRFGRSDDVSIRESQVQKLRAAIDPPTFIETLQLLPTIRQLDEAAHVALMDLIQPAMRQLSRPQLQQLTGAAKALIEADGRDEHSLSSRCSKTKPSRDERQRRYRRTSSFPGCRASASMPR